MIWEIFVIGVSYGLEFFTHAKSYVIGGINFQIPWPCSYLKSTEIFVEVFQLKRKFHLKKWDFVIIFSLTSFWASFFENPKFFHFCWHIIWLVCSAVTIFILTQRTRLGAPSRYLENIRKLSTENFLEAFENEFSPHKVCFCQAQNEARIF